MLSRVWMPTISVLATIETIRATVKRDMAFSCSSKLRSFRLLQSRARDEKTRAKIMTLTTMEPRMVAVLELLEVREACW